MLHHGCEVPAEDAIRRTCEHPRCVNPLHLERQSVLHARRVEQLASELHERRQSEERERVARAERDRREDAEIRALRERVKPPPYMVQAATPEELPARRECRHCGADTERANLIQSRSSKTGLYRQIAQCRPCARATNAGWYRRSSQSPGGLVKRVVSSARKRARDTGMAFDLTHEFVAELYRRQGGRCALTDIAFEFNDFRTGWQSHPHNPSLDRIDSKGGYTQDNVRFVLLVVNVALRDWGLEVVLPALRALTKRQVA
jgi:rubredoxin